MRPQGPTYFPSSAHTCGSTLFLCRVFCRVAAPLILAKFWLGNAIATHLFPSQHPRIRSHLPRNHFDSRNSRNQSIFSFISIRRGFCTRRGAIGLCQTCASVKDRAASCPPSSRGRAPKGPGRSGRPGSRPHSNWRPSAAISFGLKSDPKRAPGCPEHFRAQTLF